MSVTGRVFVGRDTELASLTALIDRASAGQACVGLISGDPGIGKTRLGEEFGSHGASRGFLEVWGRCFEGEGAPAYWPWVQIIRTCISAVDPAALTGVVPATGSELARLVPEIAESPATPAIPESDSARFRLFEEVAHLLAALSANQPLLVVIDDLHSADTSSLLLFEFLSRQGFLGPARVVLVGIYRSTEADHRPWFGEFLGRVGRQIALRLSLQPLSETDMVAYIAEEGGGIVPRGAEAAILREARGNPLFLSECVRLVADDPSARASPEGIEAAIGRGVQEVLQMRLGRLSPGCRKLLSAAAVAGAEFSLAALSALEMEPAALFAALAEAERARVVEAREGGRFAFRHQLIRDGLYGQATATERYVMHGKIGDALERVVESNPEVYVAELAYHFGQAAPIGYAAKAANYARRAGEQALAKLAYGEAAAAFEAALRHLAFLPRDPAREEELLQAAGQARRYDGQTDAARDAFRRAADSARARLGTADSAGRESFARAALGFAASAARVGARDAAPTSSREKLASLYTTVFDPEALAIVEEALAALGDAMVPARPALMARLAWLLYYTGELERREDLAREAVVLARRVGDRSTLAFCLWAQQQVLTGRSSGEDRVAIAREILALAHSAGDRELALQGYQALISALFESGNMASAENEIGAYARAADAGHFAFHQWHSALLGAAASIATGNFAVAEVRVSDAFRLARRAQSPNPALRFTVQRFILRREQGRLRELGMLEGDLAVAFGRIPAWRWAVPILLAGSGLDEEARRWFAEAASAGFEVLRTDPLRLTALAFAADACVTAGDAAVGAEVFAELEPAAGQHIVIADGVAVLGPAEYYLGRLALLCGRPTQAAAYLATAQRMAEQSGLWPVAARVRLERARLGGNGAEAHAREALQAAERLGMATLATEAGEALSRLQPASVALPAGLTAREAEVLGLLAAGKTNSEIAEALVLSRHTVVRHLANAYAKIGATNRAEATAFATRHGLA